MEYVVKALAIAGLAASFALKINRIMVNRFGEGAVKFLIPLVEEVLKTGSARLFGFSVPVIHLGFGLYEAGYDLLANPGTGTKRWLAALLALIGHGLFGWVTWQLMTLTGSLVLAAASACTAHVFWNMVVLVMKR
ncbi:MAG: hypothetical protein GX855_03855 [Firmicutes bacterium]|nr:hypothetical protein [Bacillota bacterium]